MNFKKTIRFTEIKEYLEKKGFTHKTEFGADYKLAAYNLGNMLTPEPITKVDRLRSFVTFEAFMTLGTLKFLFVPQETNDPMMVEGMYARH